MKIKTIGTNVCDLDIYKPKALKIMQIEKQLYKYKIATGSFNVLP